MTPGKLLSLSGAYWSSCALHAAVNLRVFSILGDETLEAGEVARRLGADSRGTRLLLNALAALELLQKREGLFANSPLARECLVEGGPNYLGHSLLHHRNLLPSWGRLDEAVITGKPTRHLPADDPEAVVVFQQAMNNSASAAAPLLAGEVDLEGKRRLLDLGGGPGTHAAHFCRRFPGLEAVVFDRPSSRPLAEGLAARLGVAGRVTFAAGDYHSDPLPGTFDAAWLSQILHAEDPEVCARLVAKAAAALEPGGLLLIHEFLLTDTEDGPLFPALFALNMLAGTEGGQSYSEREVREWMERAGLGGIRRLAFRGPHDSGVLAGEKP